MAEDRCDAADVRASVARKRSSGGAAREALSDVRDDHRPPRRSAEEPHRVHAPGIPAAAAAEVDAIPTRREAGSDVGRGNRPEEIAAAESEDEAERTHTVRTRIMRARGLAGLAGLAGLGVGAWALVVRGSFALDLGVGRRYRPLGPIVVSIAAPREVVFDVVSAPYLGRTPRALKAKLEVLERGDDFVLAAHHTHTYGLTATTVETVRFERPERVHFRLVRGPVPHVVEQFLLRETESGTELAYSGELGTDLWLAGELWGAAVARTWEATVRESLESVRIEAERRAKRR